MPDPVANAVAINNRAANIVTLTTALGARPEHGFLRNLKSGNKQEFLFNPREFTEVYEALYARKAAPGLSHERLQFLGNRNGKINLDLIYDEYFLQRGFIGSNSVGGISNRRPQETGGTVRVSPSTRVEAIKRFFLAAIYPRRSSKLISAAPPPLLFVWPGEISMKVRLMRVSFRHAEFQVKSAHTRVLIVTLNLEEEVEERIYSQDVFGYGTHRPWATAAASRRRRG